MVLGFRRAGPSSFVEKRDDIHLLLLGEGLHNPFFREGVTEEALASRHTIARTDRIARKSYPSRFRIDNR